MKNRKLAFLLCLTLLFSVLSPAMSFASSPETTTPVDDPLDPDPYIKIDSIFMTFSVTTAGVSTSACNVYVPDTSLHYTVTMEVLKQASNGSWETNALKAWSYYNRSGTTDIPGKTFSLTDYGTYCLAVTVDVYNSNDILVDSATEYSRNAVYTANGVTYHY